MPIRQDSVCRRLCSLGVRKPLVHSLLNQVNTWVRSSGPEWTVERLKAYKLDFVKSIAGQPDLSPWISRHRSGAPKGAFRSFFENEFKARERESCFLPTACTGSNQFRKLHRISVMRQKTLMVLMLYANFYSRHVTEKQLSKFVNSVTKSWSPHPEDLKWKETIGNWLDETARSLVFSLRPLNPEEVKAGAQNYFRRPSKITDWVPDSTRVPLAHGKTCSNMDISDWWLDNCISDPAYSAFMSYPRVFEGLKEDIIAAHTFHSGALTVLSGNPLDLDIEDPDIQKLVFGGPRSRCVGRIGFIQEPGFKLRAVANPNRLLQLALEPLKESIQVSLERAFGLYSRRRSDFTTDQDLGVKYVQSWLRQGRTVHCVDLSDATNHFPLIYQTRALRSWFSEIFHPARDKEKYLYYQELVSLWEDVSKGLWEVKGPSGSLQWTVGQPLGLGPSFPAFAFTHNLLLHNLAVRHGGEFAILGDDVAIVGDKLHDQYRKVLYVSECPVSEHKCLSSDRAAEFAGKLITRDAVLSGYKWKEVSDRSFLDHCRLLGQRSASCLRPRQRHIFNMIAEVPKELGGLGFNPKGKTLDRRIEENWSTIEMLNTTTLNKVKVVRAESKIDALRIKTSFALHIEGLTPLRRAADNLILGVGEPSVDFQPARLEKGTLAWILDLKNCARTEPITLEQGTPEQEEFLKRLRMTLNLRSHTRESRDPRGPSQLENLEKKLSVVNVPTQKPKAKANEAQDYSPQPSRSDYEPPSRGRSRRR